MKAEKTTSNIDLQMVDYVCDELGCELKKPTKSYTRTNIYHKKGTIENAVFKFCKKYRLSIRSTMSLMSLISVVIVGIVLLNIADFLMHSAIFSIVDSVGLIGDK